MIWKSRRWVQTFYMFIPTWGDEQILTNIFQMGWNHQLEIMKLYEILNIYLYIYIWGFYPDDHHVLSYFLYDEDQVHKFQVSFRQCHCGLWSFFSLKCRGMEMAGKHSERWMRSLNVENNSGHQDMWMWFWRSLLDLTWMRLRSPSLNFFCSPYNSQAQIQHSWVHTTWREGKTFKNMKDLQTIPCISHMCL